MPRTLAAEPMDASGAEVPLLPPEAQVNGEQADESEEAAIERRLREAVRLTPEQCLFCSYRSADQVPPGMPAGLVCFWVDPQQLSGSGRAVPIVSWLFIDCVANLFASCRG